MDHSPLLPRGPRRLAPKALLLSFLLPLLGCNKQGAETNEIVIGEFGSLTGGTATFGQSTRKGIDMALEEVNQAGGVLGKKIRVIVEDNQGKPEEAQTVVTKLINKDRVVAVLGEVASSRSLAAAPLCQQAGIPMITPASTNPKVTQVGPFIFRTCFIDPFQGEVMAKFAFSSLKLAKVAILRDVKNDYSIGLANFFAESFQKMGGSIVADISYSEGDTDFGAQLTALKAKNPDAVFLPGYYTEVGLIARQARKLGLTQPFLGGDGWDSPKLWEIGGEALNDCYYSNHYSPQNPSAMVQGFISKFKERNAGEVPDAMAALGYDAAKLLADAIKRAGSAKPDSIRIALSRTRDFEGVTGTMTLNEERNPVKPAVVLKVKDGEISFVEQVNP